VKYCYNTKYNNCFFIDIIQVLAGIPIEELENFVGANLYSHMPLLTTASVFKHRVLLDSVNHSITPSLPFQKEQVSFAADVT